MNSQKVFCWLGLWFGLFGFSQSSWAAADSERPPNMPMVQYVYLDPVFLVNYGDSGRLRYLRTQVAVKVGSAEAVEKVTANMPYLRNDLILLFSAQSAEVISTPQGRESLRQLALDGLRGRLLKLTDQPYIEDLYFSNFVTQN